MHSTNNLNDGYLGSGTYLKRSINKHGRENHSIEIIEFFNTRDDLKARERELVSLQEIAKKDCMNLKIGGTGGFNKEHQLLGSKNGVLKANELRVTNPEWWEECKRKFSIGAKLTYSEGRRPRINVFDWTGRNHTEQTKQKMSLSHSNIHKGNKNSQYGTCWITDGVKNKKILKEDIIP